MVDSAIDTCGHVKLGRRTQRMSFITMKFKLQNRGCTESKRRDCDGKVCRGGTEIV